MHTRGQPGVSGSSSNPRTPPVRLPYSRPRGREQSNQLSSLAESGRQADRPASQAATRKPGRPSWRASQAGPSQLDHTSMQFRAVPAHVPYVLGRLNVPGFGSVPAIPHYHHDVLIRSRQFLHIPIERSSLLYEIVIRSDAFQCVLKGRSSLMSQEVIRSDAFQLISDTFYRHFLLITIAFRQVPTNSYTFRMKGINFVSKICTFPQVRNNTHAVSDNSQ